LAVYSDLVGIKFVDKGRNPSTGVDCWGLIMLAFERYGWKIPDFNVSCFASSDIHAKYLLNMRGWKSVDVMREATVVAMSMDPDMPNVVQHFGYATDTHNVLHTLLKMGSVNMRINHPFIKHKIKGYYEWIG
jgi:hypothetical protein